MVNRSFLERKLSRLVEYIDDLDEQKGITLADWQSNKILRKQFYSIPSVSDRFPIEF
jgi:hypothetical protein